jgi:scyllo-inositol 2-dehydrogenase (NADP+)
MSTFRVGLIGYGHGGAIFHAPLVAATPGLELAAIVTGDPDRRARARSRYPSAAIVPDVDALWASASDLDLIVVASPNRSHVPLGMAALAHDLPVVIDKPLAASSGDARMIVDEAQRRGRLLTVFQNRRWDGDFITVRKLIADGRLGSVFRYESRFERWRPMPRPGWRQDAAPEDAGGLLFDLGSHLIDQALMLFGPVTAIHAELDRRRAGVHVDDDSFVALQHASGVRSHLWMSAVAAEPGPRMRVLGLQGAYVKYGLDVQEDALADGANPADDGFGLEPRDRWGSLTSGGQTLVVETERGGYRQFYEAIVTSLRTGAPPPVDPRDAIRTLEIIEAAQKSAGTSAVVRL